MKLKNSLKNEIKYYEYNFSGKDFGTAMYDVLRKELISLLRVYVKFLYLKSSLEIIANEEISNKNLSNYHSNMLESSIKGVNAICEQLYNIIEPIVKTINE